MFPSTTGGRYTTVIRAIVLLAIFAAVCNYVVSSWRWMLLCDSPVLHYVNFLMDHGLQPYRDITDNNLPGSYLSEAFGITVFGAGDFAWRLYEFFLLSILTAAAVVITWPYDWAAGVFASGLFIAMHGREGPWVAVEREEIMSTLVLLSYAALFLALRRRTPWLWLVTGCGTAFATWIKPTIAPLCPLLFLLGIVQLRRLRIPVISYGLYGVLGIALGLGINVGFLLRHHALYDFIRTQRLITAFYISAGNASLPYMLHELIPVSLLIVVFAAGALAWRRHSWTWEQYALALGAVIGLYSYFQQHKGYLHHRYLFLILVLLLSGMELFPALRLAGRRRMLSAAVLVAVTVFTVPKWARSTYRVQSSSPLTLSLQNDLTHLSAHAPLQQQVQCLDLVFGCYTALLRMGVLQHTGFTGDLVVLAPGDGPAIQHDRAQWWQQLTDSHSANLLVVTNEYFHGNNTYAKLRNWPQYDQYIQAHYTLLTERSFPDEAGTGSTVGDPALANGYRIYARKEGPFAGHDPGPHAEDQSASGNRAMPSPVLPLQ